MKRMLCLVALVCVLVIAGCSKSGTAEKWDRRPMVMVAGEIFMDTGKQMPVEIEESAILGEIVSSVDGSQMPTHDGESNFGCEGAPYAYHNDGLANAAGQ